MVQLILACSGSRSTRLAVSCPRRLSLHDQIFMNRFSQGSVSQLWYRHTWAPPVLGPSMALQCLSLRLWSTCSLDGSVLSGAGHRPQQQVCALWLSALDNQIPQICPGKFLCSPPLCARNCVPCSPLHILLHCAAPQVPLQLHHPSHVYRY